MTHATTQLFGLPRSLHVFIPIPLPNACLVPKCIGNFFFASRAMTPSPAATAACLAAQCRSYVRSTAGPGRLSVLPESRCMRFTRLYMCKFFLDGSFFASLFCVSFFSWPFLSFSVSRYTGLSIYEIDYSTQQHGKARKLKQP